MTTVSFSETTDRGRNVDFPIPLVFWEISKFVNLYRIRSEAVSQI